MKQPTNPQERYLQREREHNEATRARARRYVASRATGVVDARTLLDMLGLLPGPAA